MEQATFQPITPRPAPVNTEGAVPWLKRNLFSNLPSTVATLLFVALAVWWLPALLNWGLTKAVFAANADQCQAARGAGACWGVVTEKYRLILFGRYPVRRAVARR